MTYEERTTWAQLLVAIVGTLAYVVIVLRQGRRRPAGRRGLPVDDAVGDRAVDRRLDPAEHHVLHRERRAQRSAATSATSEISAFGTRMGQAWIVIGALAAMLMAMAEWDWFWIANVDLPLLRARRRSSRASPRSSPTAAGSPSGEADAGHQPHPRPALRARRDDPGRAGRPARRDPPDRHRHRAGALLALARDGVPDRPCRSAYRWTTSSTTRTERHT